MKNNMTKKQIHIKQLKLINAIAADEAVVCKQSTGRIKEQHLLRSMLPQNEIMMRFARELYSEEEPNLAKIFRAIFEYFALDVEKGEYARSIVSCYHSLSFGVITRSSESPDLLLAASEMGFIANRLENKAADMNAHLSELLKEGEELRYFQSLICQHREIAFTSVICIMLSSWQYLFDCPNTYRLLSAIASIQTGINNSAETRHTLVQKLKEFPPECLL